jgi:hypothetical protein
MESPAPLELYLDRETLIEGLRGGGTFCRPEDQVWEQGWCADLLQHASVERLSPAGLAALAVARRCFDQATQAVRELQRAKLALADALETPQL